MPAFWGALVGILCAALLLLVTGVGILGAGVGVLGVAALPVLGGLLGHLRELRRILRRAAERNEADAARLSELSRSSDEALMELAAWRHENQRIAGTLREQTAVHERQLGDALAGFQEFARAREEAVRSHSHDLRDPMVFLLNATWLLRPHLEPDDAEGRGVLVEIDEMVKRMRREVSDLLAGTGTDSSWELILQARSMEISHLADALRGRLESLMLGREAHSHVVTTEEAPGQIRCDPKLFDSVMENLLNHAVHHTSHGVIEVKLGGTGEGLVVMVSGLGAGFGSGELRRALGLDPPPLGRRVDATAKGLATALRLLHQVGGRLELRSLPGTGTAFWVYFPIIPRPPRGGTRGEAQDSLEEIASRVVTLVPAHQ